MLRLLMGSGCFWRSVGLDQDEARGVILLLGEVKPGDARFLQAFAGVGDGGLFERLNVLRLHPDTNVHNEHGILSTGALLQTKRSLAGSAGKSKTFKRGWRAGACRPWGLLLRSRGRRCGSFSFVNASLDKGFEVFAVTRFFHFFHRDETERG